MDFLPISGCETHLNELHWNQLRYIHRKAAYEFFSIERRFWRFKSRFSRFKETCTWGHQRAVPPSRTLFYHCSFYHLPTFSCLCHLYCTEDKDTARWQIIRRRRPTSLEQFAGCTAGRRGLRTVQSATKDTFVWLIETAAPSDFCF